MESIIQLEKECYVCGTTENLHCHHTIGGTSNRKNSDDFGLTVFLCARHHSDAHHDPVLNKLFKRLGQRHFELTHTREEFIKIFGKSFIADDVMEEII